MRVHVLVGVLLVGAIQAWAQAGVPAEPQLTAGQTLERNGDVQMARKQYRDAIDAYEAWTKKEPKNPVAWNKMGIAHHQLMNLGKARNCYERAIRLRKEYAEAINNVGTVYYAEKNYKKAIRYYERALKITPLSASVHSNLGTAWFSRKKYDEALAAYQKALQLDPEVFEHRNSVGVLLQERSVADRARFHYFLAKTYAGAGNKEKAIEYLRKAMEEGFAEMKKVTEDQAFAELIKTPEFTELMTNPPAPIPR